MLKENIHLQAEISVRSQSQKFLHDWPSQLIIVHSWTPKSLSACKSYVNNTAVDGTVLSKCELSLIFPWKMTRRTWEMRKESQKVLNRKMPLLQSKIYDKPVNRQYSQLFLLHSSCWFLCQMMKMCFIVVNIRLPFRYRYKIVFVVPEVLVREHVS